MAQNPFEAVILSLEKLSTFVQTNLSNLMLQYDRRPPTTTTTTTTTSTVTKQQLLFPVSDSKTSQSTIDTKEKSSGPVSKEELGRCSWTFLHTLAARYPEKPSRQQKKDAKELMAILSRMYPCKECAEHFKAILRENPVQVGSQAEFSQWLCYVHNLVNRSVGKPVFPCERLEARWGKSECEHRECDVLGDTLQFPSSSRKLF